MSSARALRPATTIYLLLPISLFAWGWLRPPLALVVLLLCAALCAAAAWDFGQAFRAVWLALWMRPRAVLRSQVWVAPAALLLAGWLLLSGAGGLGYQNNDYRASNALLKDLILGAWPLKFQLDGQTVPLVYYVAYYLPAAAVGKAFGWLAANICLWIWTAVGSALALAWFQHLSRASLRQRAGRLLMLTILFCLAGGLDFIAVTILQAAPPTVNSHLEFWAGHVQYSSSTTLLYWVPQQALAAWLALSLVIDAIYHVHDLRYLGVSLAACLLWSPLALIGLLPYLLLLAALCLAPARRRAWLRPLPLMAQGTAVGLTAILGLYLSANRFRFPAGWIWEHSDNPARLALFLFAFWWVEFGLMALLLLFFLAMGLRTLPCRHSRPLARHWLDGLRQCFDLAPQQLMVFGLSLASLTVLPLFRMGFNNDLAMRASIPSLFVLWTVTAKVVIDADQRVAARQFPVKLRLAYLLLVGVVAASLLTGLTEAARSARYFRLGPPPLAAVATTADANLRHIVEQRAGDGQALFFRYLAR